MTVTEDRVLGGAVRLRQARDGYRAGLDAALLAAACDAGQGQRVLEVGCGVGAALLAAASRRPRATFTGLERDEAACVLARENISLNQLGERVSAVAWDVAAPFRGLGLAPFDLAMANPPFFDDAARLRAPAPAKRSAWMADDGLGAWIAFMIAAARQGGAVVLVHRADRLSDILAALASKAGSIQIRSVHPFADQPAKRVLVRAVKSGKAPLRLLPPLILHQHGGAKHTGEVEAILRGEADLSWL
ncbi:MAG TPA: methyltransferase [Caulobacteraceae bacterium]|nr:methyltransferase [Caulobacteraceae bacterium]